MQEPILLTEINQNCAVILPWISDYILLKHLMNYLSFAWIQQAVESNYRWCLSMDD